MNVLSECWFLIFGGQGPVSDAEAEAPTLWPPDVKSQLVGKSLMLGKIEGKRRRGKQRMRRLDDITDSMDIDSTPGFCPVQGRGAWHPVVHGVTKSGPQLRD